MPDSLHRRLLLGGVSSGIASLLLPGCTVFESEDEGLVLNGIYASNMLDESYTLRLELERDNEMMLEETIQLEGGTSELIDADFSQEPAIYNISFVGFGPDIEPDIRTKKVTTADQNEDYDCMGILIAFTDDISPVVFSEVVNPRIIGEECPD